MFGYDQTNWIEEYIEAGRNLAEKLDSTEDPKAKEALKRKIRVNQATIK